jgi:hypothetical protein
VHGGTHDGSDPKVVSVVVVVVVGVDVVETAGKSMQTHSNAQTS